ncbi:MAG: hypothetical protein U0893_24035 [Chloroflexota bacterium]
MAESRQWAALRPQLHQPAWRPARAITSYSAVPMTVRAAAASLVKHDGERPSDRSTRHIEIALPPA